MRRGLATEAEVTAAAERLYTARFQLGLFDPQGSNPLDKIPFTDVASDANRAKALKAAEESIVLLKNDGTLPLKGSAKRIAVVGPTADLLASILGNYVGTPVQPVTPLDGMLADKSREVFYAQGSSLAAGFAVPVPRTVFDIKKGLKTEFFATPDWTGRPSCRDDGARRPSRLGKCQACAASGNRQLLSPLVGHHHRTSRWSLRLHARPRRQFSVLAQGVVPNDHRWQGSRRGLTTPAC